MKLTFKMVFSSILMLALLYPCLAFAKTSQTKNITDEAQLSFIDAQGNTEMSTLLLVNTLKYIPLDYLMATWKIEALKSSQDGEDKAERYTTSIRLDYRIKKRLYSFADVLWLQDEFANIDDRYYMGAGLGYKILVGPKQILESEAGVNYTIDTYDDNTDDNYSGGRLYGRYTYNFTGKNKFDQTVEYLHDFENNDNYNVNSDTAFTAALNSRLSLKTSYKIKYDNKPVGGAEYADRIMAVTLVVNFL